MAGSATVAPLGTVLDWTAKGSDWAGLLHWGGSVLLGMQRISKGLGG